MKQKKRKKDVIANITTSLFIYIYFLNFKLCYCYLYLISYYFFCLPRFISSRVLINANIDDELVNNFNVDNY